MLIRCDHGETGAGPTTTDARGATRPAAISSTLVADCSSNRGSSRPASVSWSPSRAWALAGAFYHHFRDKAELFRAVFEEVERDLTLRALASPARWRRPWERLTSGLQGGFLQAASEPEVQRVMLVDGPVVLGWQTLRSIQESNSIAMIDEVVREAIAEGDHRRPTGPRTHPHVGRRGGGSIAAGGPRVAADSSPQTCGPDPGSDVAQLRCKSRQYVASLIVSPSNRPFITV